MPKSRIFTTPPGASITFEGFRSRCSTRWPWATAQRVGELHGDADGLIFGQRPLGEPRGQRLAFDELEDDGDVAVVLDDVVHGGDGGMADGGGGAGFVEQLGAAAGGAGLRARHGLQRDVAAEARVFGEHHRAHAALAELAHHSIRADRRAAHG